jgi:hypothetical protein
MEIEITSALATAYRKIVLAQQEVDRLTQRGKGRRDPDMKYWMQELTDWTNYANELNKRLYHGQIELSKQIRADGGIHVKTTRMGRFVDFFPQTALPSEIFDSLIVEDDYSENNPECARCGARGTQLHHWAPKELFGDAEQWPQSYLCRIHHQEWHDKVTNKFRTLRRREERINAKPAA